MSNVFTPASEIVLKNTIDQIKQLEKSNVKALENQKRELAETHKCWRPDKTQPIPNSDNFVMTWQDFPKWLSCDGKGSSASVVNRYQNQIKSNNNKINELKRKMISLEFEVREDERIRKIAIIDFKKSQITKFGSIGILLLGGLGYMLYSSRNKD